MVLFRFSFVHSWRGERGHEFFSFFSTLELGKWLWVLLFYLLLFSLILEGGKGGLSFFLKENFTLERGRRVWVYLFTIHFLNFNIIYILLSHFLTPKGGGWHGFYFSSFFYFFYCVLSFCYHFLLLPGEGGVVFLFFNYYFIYF